MTFDPNPVSVSHFGGVVEGELELVAVATGLPAGGQVLYGSVSPGATTLVLRGRVDVGSAPLLYLGIREIGSLSDWISFGGLGWIPGAGEDIASAIEGLPGTAGFLTPGPVAAGSEFDLVFMSYDAGLVADGSLEFVAALLGAPEEVGTAVLVPEPAPSLLVLGSLVAIGASRADRQRQPRVVDVDRHPGRAPRGES